MGQFDRELDKKELQVYEKHGKVDQLIFNDKEAHIFDLVAHPEWQELTGDMQEVYLATLEEFNLQLVGENYFVRGDIKGRQARGALRHAIPAPDPQPKTGFFTKVLRRMRNLFNQHQFLLSQSHLKLTDLIADNNRLKQEISDLRKEKMVVHDAQHVINTLVNQFFAMGNDKDLKDRRLKEASRFLQDETIEQMIEKEGRGFIESLDYSNVKGRLQEVILNLTQPSV